VKKLSDLLDPHHFEFKYIYISIDISMDINKHILSLSLFIFALVALPLPCCAAFQSRIPDPFPQPKYPVNNRTAVLLSGQLRFGNVSLFSSYVKGYRGGNITKWVGIDDPPTAIASHLEHFLRVLGEYGGVDMFIYIQTDLRHGDNYTWDGRPETYEVSETVKHVTYHSFDALTTIAFSGRY
jgi:hypothetical protein